MNTRYQHRASRRGITLTEVLISMFVLLIGLMGVGAMIPAGRYEIMQGVKADYAAMVGREAYRDMKVRGFLDPTNWTNASNSAIYNPTSATPFTNPINLSTQALLPVAIDSLGLTAATSFGNSFPYVPSAMQPIARIFPTPQPAAPQNQKLLANAIFRCPDDLTLIASTLGRDRPPVQQSVPYNQDPLNPLNPILARSSEGNYSWMATVIPEPTILPEVAAKVTVSVAVFYKRDLSVAGAGEATGDVTFVGTGLGGGEITLNINNDPSSKFPNGVRPGQWLMLAGTTAGSNSYYRWYRVQGASQAVRGTIQYVTLHGPDWNVIASPNVSAWIFDGVIGVYEKNIRLEWN
jgi:hypothetical protein